MISSTIWYRSKVFTLAHHEIWLAKLRGGKGWGLFRSDWRESAVFSPLIYGGKPLAPREGEENSGRGQDSPVDKWLEKTSPGALAASGGLGAEEKVPALSG